MLHTYIIGEIGQNHNGSVDIAKLIVDLISRPVREELFNIDLLPMDAVKMTKRDLSQELSYKQQKEIYNSIHSFGKTYGDHRKFLELSEQEHFEVFRHAKLKGLDFVETICAKGGLKLLKYFTPDRIKIASRDLTNLPLIEMLSETKIPMILSTGMAGKSELDIALEIITKYHSNISILHCTSEYPLNPKNVNLNSIIYLKDKYPSYKIGFSDHTIGISAPVAAVALGAEIIEKHVTIDRRMKGTDQAGSLGPDGINRMIRDIRVTEISLGEKDFFVSEASINSKIKLERSIASNRLIRIGESINERDIHLLSPGNGYKWIEKEKIIGKIAKTVIKKNEIIYPNMIK